MKGQQFFKGCATTEEVKAKYRELAKKHHPDIEGGNAETMKAINDQYDKLIKGIIENDEEIADSEKADFVHYDTQYREAIEKIIHLTGINIEMVGDWIWVTGETYNNRQALAEASYFFSKNKQAWYFRSDKYKSMNKGKSMSLDEIRGKYGSEEIKSKKQDKISA